MTRLGNLEFTFQRPTVAAAEFSSFLKALRIDDGPLTAQVAAAVLPGPAAKLSRQDPQMHPKDEFVFLLQTAAEVEHAFLIQYLFMAYSLPNQSPQRAWRRGLLQIAREEMGHFLSMQNLLLSMGAPLCMGRNDAPFKNLFPFPFELAPFSLRSVGRFVLAEMPEPNLIPGGIGFNGAELLADAELDITLADITRVGALFDLMMELAAELTEEPDPSNVTYQAKAAEWRAPINQLILGEVARLADILPLLTQISAQGEGSMAPAAGSPSHFERLHAIYVAARAHVMAHGAGSLTSSIVRDPTRADRNAVGYVRHPDAARWADILNHRYRWLLAIIGHSLAIGADGSQRKGDLIRWAFEEMQHTIAPISELLVTLPQSDLVGATALAGPPFDLPYTTDLPGRQADLWRHQAMLLSHATDQLSRVPSGSVGFDLAQQIAALDAARSAVIATGG